MAVVRENHIGRFAPTPSGEMHFGNLLCALISYLSAKKADGRFIVRIEDLDAARCPRESANKILKTLDRFGLKSDEPPVFQSERTPLYERKQAELDALGLTYPCFCTRAQLHAAEAPRLSDGGIIYAGTCKTLTNAQKTSLLRERKPCIRIAVPDEAIAFTDGLKGEYTQNLAKECGDFIIRRSDGVFAYQLAVAVDDGEAGVTEVIRGDDLIASTPRQIWLMRLLGYTPPKYLHIPLVCDSRGRKLSKSEGDKISEKAKTLSVERILGALGFAIGIISEDREATLNELISAYSPQKIKPVIRLPELLD